MSSGALAITTVGESIAALDITGVDVRDLDHIPVTGIRLTPILFPDPDRTISNFVPERVSFGGGSSALANADYDLNYLFLYAPTGDGRTGLEYHGDRMRKLQAIWDAILSIDTINGCVDVWPVGNVEFTNILAPDGTNYMGCRLTFHVKEFWR